MIDNKLFKTDIPLLNPLGLDYLNFWKQEKKRCIEGYWQQGKYMPGVAYQYINHWKIELNKGKNSKQKVIDHPFLRDLEWEKSRIFLEARGFSGFEFDYYHTCERDLEGKIMFWDEYENKRIIDPTQELLADLIDNKRRYKEIVYVPAREYLKWVHPKNMGRPLMNNSAKNVVDIESRGCLAKGTKVLMFDGSNKNAEDIKVGDLLMGKDSTPRKVEWIHSGIEDMYEIQQSLGLNYTVNKNHIIHLKRKLTSSKYKNYPEYLNITVEELLKKSKTFLSVYRGYKVGVEFSKKEIDIDPYFLGVWLGDGNSEKVAITTMDKEIVDVINNVAISFNQKVKKLKSTSKGRASTYCITNGYVGSKKSKILEIFRKYNLLKNKHIPDSFKITDSNTRLEVLAGLIDTDGYYHNNYFEITQKSERLIKDIEYIADTLGFRTSLRKIKKKCKTHNFEGEYFSLSISGELSRIPTKLKRKKATNSFTDKSINIIKNIVYKGKDMFYGFHVDVDNLYLLRDCTVLHNTGKSFFASNMLAWNFLHDGVFWYDELANKPKSETMIGAIDTKYSSGLIKKLKLGLENLPGAIELGDKYYPPPLLKQYTGTFRSGDTVTAEYDIKIGDSWVKKGSKSMIYHRSFADNPMAGNGTRPGLIALEEVGFMGNLEEALGQLTECTNNGTEKFGTIWMFGTGGDMAGGSTEAVKKVFYDPDAYDCLVFEDEYESKGKIGYFCPAWKGLNQFKDEQGNTDKDSALGYLLKEREKKSNAKTKQALYDELQQRPIVPSEAFLILEGNVFPVAELKDHLAFLESNQKTKDLATNGWMHRDNEGKAYFKVDHNLIPTDYPTKTSVDATGCVQVWEEPIPNAPHGLYIGGIDPYDQDKASNSVSMGSIIIYKTFINADQTYQLPVAEYTGRPEFAKDFYEQCRRLLEWYNAKALYENEKTGLKTYFETKNCLHLLHRQPNIIKSISPNSKVDRTYGTHMSKTIKEEIEIMTRDWLKEELEPGIMQLTKIYSLPLLRELISYNVDGNFDRVIAFMLCIMQKLEMHRIIVKEAKNEDAIDPFFTRALFR